MSAIGCHRGRAAPTPPAPPGARRPDRIVVAYVGALLLLPLVRHRLDGAEAGLDVVTETFAEADVRPRLLADGHHRGR